MHMVRAAMQKRPQIDDHAETWVLPADELAARRKGESADADKVRTLSMQELEQILKTEKAPK